jgi:hypothetical protein
LSAAVGLAALMVVSSAQAASIPLVVEFDDGTLGTYGSVDVTEDGFGNLDFLITLNPDEGDGSPPSDLLGPTPDLHEFYFNLIGEFTDLTVTTSDMPTTAYSLLGPNPPIAGGAGASFDWGVNFGNGSSDDGNGFLNPASFTLDALEDLALTDLNEFSTPNNTNQDVLVAVHIQSTEPFGSETVGGGPPGFVLPEPSTALLLGLGIAGLAAGSRRRRD